MISKIILYLIFGYIGLFVIVFCLKQLYNWLQVMQEEMQNTSQIKPQQYTKPKKRKNMKFNKSLGVWEIE